MKKEIKFLYARENTGIGLLTSIINAFGSIFGFSNQKLNDKVSKVVVTVTSSLTNQAKKFGADEIKDFRINSSGLNLTVIGYCVAVKYVDDKKEESASSTQPSPISTIKKCQYCDSLLSNDDVFCGNCGRKCE